MGLDMYAKKTKGINSKVDFECTGESEDLFYWRKHPDLHGFIKKIYERKGGEDESFNCSTVILNIADIEEIEKAVLERKLPHTEGFFFGKSNKDDMENDMKFIMMAKIAIAQGWQVFYMAWY